MTLSKEMYHNLHLMSQVLDNPMTVTHLTNNRASLHHVEVHETDVHLIILMIILYIRDL